MFRYFLLLCLLFCVLFVANIAIGSVSIPVGAIFDSLFGTQTTPITDKSWAIIIKEYRLPKTLTAVLAGAGLAVSGLQSQTLFRNPLASPDLLGLSAGASLGVAAVIFLKNSLPTFLFLQGQWLTITAAIAGAGLVLFLLLVLANKTQATTLLIMGFMFTAILGAVVSLLQYFSSADTLQQYIMWTYGALNSVSWQQMPYFVATISLGLLLALLIQKPLNAWLLGEQYAQSMGVNIAQTKLLLILSVALLAGGVTAFCGFIGFLAVAVPHLTFALCKTSNHYILLPFTMLLGATGLLFCDILCSLSPASHLLPVNIVTALLGSPVVIWVVWKQNRE
jgi:iron complex transport system permease protein